MAIAVAIAPADAAANAQICRQLEAELASASRSGPSSQARRYDAAIQKQQAQIGKAREQARQIGCGRAMFGRAVSQCANLNATIDRMQGNLADLQAKRSKMGGSGSRSERRRVQAELNANGCRDAAREAASTASPPAQGIVINGRLRIGGLPGTFRTLCVRTCDGYFFPVSYGVSSSAFDRDSNACKAMCPGANVELHYHRVPGEESSDMVSAATGLPYSQMPTANAYREGDASTRAGCGCQSATAGASAGERGFAVIGGDYAPPPADTQQTSAVPSQLPPPALAETPASEEGESDAGSLMEIATPVPLAAPAAAAPPALAPPGERNVRVVGPTFLPDPEEAIDLRVPARPAAR